MIVSEPQQISPATCPSAYRASSDSPAGSSASSFSCSPKGACPSRSAGLVFVCVAVTVLAVQQVSDAAKYQYR